MTEIVHRHAENSAHPHVHARPAEAGRVSALAASAGGRLLLVAPLLALIWAGVFWALA